MVISTTAAQQTHLLISWEELENIAAAERIRAEVLAQMNIIQTQKAEVLRELEGSRVGQVQEMSQGAAAKSQSQGGGKPES